MMVKLSENLLTMPSISLDQERPSVKTELIPYYQ